MFSDCYFERGKEKIDKLKQCIGNYISINFQFIMNKLCWIMICGSNEVPRNLFEQSMRIFEGAATSVMRKCFHRSINGRKILGTKEIHSCFLGILRHFP